MIEVVGVDNAIAIQVCIQSFNGLTCVFVVNLLVNVVAIGGVAFREHLHIVRLDGACRCVGRFRLVVQAKIGYLCLLVSRICRDVPLPIFRLDRCCANRNLHALATDVAYVGKHLFVEVSACGYRHGGKQILGLARIVAIVR